MNRRFFIKFLLSLGFGAYFPQLAEASRLEKLYQPQDGFKPLTAVKFLRQMVTKNPATSRMIMWQTNKEIKNVRLEYFLDGENFSNFGDVGYKYFNRDDEEDFIYFCELKNLSPASLYKFRIISDDKATAWQNLKTVGENFKMLVFSDSQCANYKTWQKVADTANDNFPDAELVTVIGDLVDNGQANYQWRAWKNAAALLVSEKIFAPVIGNHECYNLKWKNSLPTIYLENFKVPSNGEENFEGYFYSFNFGVANFFVLNNNFFELDEFKPDMQKVQNEWLKNAVKNSDRRWKIVLMHKDFFDYPNDKFEDFAENFMNLFDELKIDLVLSGHVHTYRNRGKIFAKKKSARGTTYILCGRAGDQKYIEKIFEFDEVTAPNIQTEGESFITLDATEKNLSLTCYSVDGEIWDKIILTSPLSEKNHSNDDNTDNDK